MKKIKVDVVVKLTERVCNQHLKPLKLDCNMFWITNSIRAYCRSGNTSELNILRFLVHALWWNGYLYDGDCINRLIGDIIGLKNEGLIEERKLKI